MEKYRARCCWKYVASALIAISVVSGLGAAGGCSRGTEKMVRRLIREWQRRTREEQDVAPALASIPQGEDQLTISIIGTNDLHGHMEQLPRFAGFIANLRDVYQEPVPPNQDSAGFKKRDGQHARMGKGAVLLVDAGDMFQGTLASNLAEGRPVIRAYNALAYDAAAVGNHEFDFGPEGPAMTPAENQSAFGALNARAREATFPLLAANLVTKKGQKPFARPHIRPTTMVTKAGVKIGLIGVSTAATLSTTHPENVKTLRVLPLAGTIRKYAKDLRRAGAKLVVVLAHAGGQCRGATKTEREAQHCDQSTEISLLARDLSPSLVDAIVAGHTHQMIAHELNDIPVIESQSYGRYFGRIDLTLDARSHKKLEHRIFPTQAICKKAGKHSTKRGSRENNTIAACRTQNYEGKAVKESKALSRLLAPTLEKAKAMKQRSLGVSLKKRFRRSYASESSLCNLMASLSQASVPGAHMGLHNAGGVRKNLPQGLLRYGDFYESYPFDNRTAVLERSVAFVKKKLAANLRRGGGILCIAGIRMEAQCQGRRRKIELYTRGGKRLADRQMLSIATNDFLALGWHDPNAKENAPGAKQEPPQILPTIHRDLLIQSLQQGPRKLHPDDFYDTTAPRMDFPGRRPMRCGGRR